MSDWRRDPGHLATTARPSAIIDTLATTIATDKLVAHPRVPKAMIPIAVPMSQRFSKLPDVPTTAETGYPKLLAPFWLGVVAPAATPPDIVTKLNAAFRDSLGPPETRARLANLGAEIKIGTPAEFGHMLADELARWTAVAKAANIRVD